MAPQGAQSTNGEAAASAVSIDSPPPQNSKYAALKFFNNVLTGFAYQASLKLKIPDVLEKARAEGKPGLSAEEIVERLPARKSPGGPEVVSNLRRLLEPLVQDGLYGRVVVDGGKVVYSSTELSRWFAEDNEFNILGLVGYQQSPPPLKALACLEYAILDDSRAPFEIVHGTSVYKHITKDPEFGTVLSNLMTAFSNFEMIQLLETLQQSGVLQGAKKLVDVGGALGIFIAHIIKKNPHIHGINYDRAHVLSSPDAAKGVEHVAGSFFDSVPSGDVMILKLIMHNYGDEDCIHILRKCYDALPQNGKVLIIEYRLPEIEAGTADFEGRNAIGSDLIMLAAFRTGRERRKKEYEALILAAGFSSSTLLPGHDCMAVIQVCK